MDLGGFSWGLQTVIGALLLAAVLLFVVMRNKSSRSERDRSERATRDLYEQEEAARRRDESGT
jgi:hypothetical protein